MFGTSAVHVGFTVPVPLSLLRTSLVPVHVKHFYFVPAADRATRQVPGRFLPGVLEYGCLGRKRGPYHKLVLRITVSLVSLPAASEAVGT